MSAQGIDWRALPRFRAAKRWRAEAQSHGPELPGFAEMPQMYHVMTHKFAFDAPQHAASECSFIGLHGVSLFVWQQELTNCHQL
jgi:hypothetical protein